MKERTWLSILLSYAGPCRGKMAASVAQAVVILLATWVVVVNFIADVLYQYMDPRIRIR